MAVVGTIALENTVTLGWAKMRFGKGGVIEFILSMIGRWVTRPELWVVFGDSHQLSERHARVTTAHPRQHFLCTIRGG